MPFCSLRSKARLSASTSRVITEPAPTIAPAPITTGATRARVGADESALANLGPVLAEAIEIAGDRSRADIGFRPDRGVTDVRQVIDLGALADVGLLELHEIADLGAFSKLGPGRIRANGPMLALVPIARALDMAEGMDCCTICNFDAGAEDDMRLDGNVAAELCIVGEPDALRVDQGRPFLQHLLAPPPLPFELKVSELGAAVYARRLVGIALDHHRLATFCCGDVDDVREVIFPRRIVVANLVQPAEEVAPTHRHHARIAEPDLTLFLGCVLIFDHLCDAVAIAEDDPAIFQRIGGTGGEHDDTGAVITVQPIEHAPKRLGLDERCVTVEDEHRSFITGKRVRACWTAWPVPFCSA